MRQGFSGIADITVDKAQLIAILRTNREQHRATFEQAVDAFQEAAIRELDKLTRDIKGGKVCRLWIQLPVPEEHTTDYDRAIRMLEMHRGDTITLSEQAYAQLVDDNWGWSAEFFANTASYVGTGH